MFFDDSEHGSHPKKKGLTDQAFGYLAEWTGLEPATPGVTGRYSNQLNYHSMDNRSWF